MTRNKGAMTVAEAGRRGGATTAQRHGPEFYEQIGKKGGRTTAQRHGSDFYEQIGKQGGQKVKELYGPPYGASARSAATRSRSTVTASRSAKGQRSRAHRPRTPRRLPLVILSVHHAGAILLWTDPR
jgi:general stress protein YciG